MARVYYLVGLPATGKRTIGLALSEATGAALIDNHLINDPVFTAIGADGRGALPREAFDLAAQVRVVVMQAVELAPGTVSHVFTNFLGVEPEDHAYVASLRRLAVSRSADFVPVWLTCDQSELEARIALPDRLVRNKLRDVARLRHLARHVRAMPPPPDALVLDTTALAPEESAARILAWAATKG